MLLNEEASRCSQTNAAKHPADIVIHLRRFMSGRIGRSHLQRQSTDSRRICEKPKKLGSGQYPPAEFGLGKHRRYRWGSPELNAWLERCAGYNTQQRKAGSSQKGETM
jgi:hypothetical protein